MNLTPKMTYRKTNGCFSLKKTPILTHRSKFNYQAKVWAEVGERKAGGAYLSRWAMARTCRANCGAGGVAAEMFKKGDWGDKKPRFLFFAPVQRDAHGGFSAEKPQNSRKMACNYSSHKANGCGNKAGECSP